MCAISVPISRVESVTDILHGVPITDPYRWLEDQNSPETRAWIDDQTRYARACLDDIPGREKIRKRVRELLDVQTYDSFLKEGNRYFFRKRLPGREQPSIYFREGSGGEDQLLIDPARRGTGNCTAVKPLRVSCDGSLLLYEVKQGGERMGHFEILDLVTRRTLPDVLPHGYLRGFVFAPDGKGFYYIHEAASSDRPFYRAVFHHVLGAPPLTDREVFRAGENPKLRLALIAGPATLGYLVYRFLDRTLTDFYIQAMGSPACPVTILRDAEYSFAPRLVPGRILAVIDQDAPNRRIVEVQPQETERPLYLDLVRETDALLRGWALTANHILASYTRGSRTQIIVSDRFGQGLREVPCGEGQTVRVVAASLDDDEVLLEQESFTQPVKIVRCATPCCEMATLVQRNISFEAEDYASLEASFSSRDGVPIPISLVARRRVLEGGTHPVVMTSYGGCGVPMTPQFSVFVAFLMERGCVFALPKIRGGSEFGARWRDSAKRRGRQVAFDDFLAAAEWLIQTARTEPEKLAIFGGSNSGLLVAVALTQRPELFRAVLCMVPLLDMLRYHLFDNAHVWKDEFGTADNAEDFAILAAYSPYHAVATGAVYPATMFVSGDADQNCNPLHARKMTARLQTANASAAPIFLDYSEVRGHSPVLPLSMRIAALTDRLAFLCDQLRIPL